MERIAIRREFLLMARAANRRRLHAERRLGRMQNSVRRVAICADRSLAIARSHHLAVNAIEILVPHASMACTAGVRNIRSKRCTLWILVAQNAMRTVATGAVRRHQQTFLAYRIAMDRIHIRRVDVRQTVLLRNLLVRMAVATGLRNVQRVHRRLRITLWHDCMRISMAACAWMSAGVGMHASGKRRLLIGVARLALYRQRLLRMRKLLNRSVAIRATQRPVNACVKSVTVDRDAMPIRVLHRLIAMTGEAIRLRIRRP